MNPHRIAIIILAEHKPAADLLAVKLGIAPKGDSTFNRALVPADGPDDAEPTHYLTSGQVTPFLTTAMQGIESAFPGTTWHRWDDISQELVASWSEENLGELWTVAQTIAQREPGVKIPKQRML